MRSNKTLGVLITLVLFVFAAGCGGGGGSSTPSPPPVLQSLTISPANPTFTVGMVTQLTATGNFSSGSPANETASVTWTSLNPSVATVSNASGSKGLVTAVAIGTTTITASVATSTGTVTNSTTVTVTDGTATPASNVMQITVNGSLCSNATASGYFNKPCVSVTLCNPGTSTCQTINDILLDTGSYGLRIFSQAITTLSLTQVHSASGGDLANCAQFADGSSLWGPVELADVKLGGQPAVTMPIQVVDYTFGTPVLGCKITSGTQYVGPDRSPQEAGFNGILGVGVFAQDCGPGCATSANNQIYFSCVGPATGSACTGAAVPVVNQLQNPVAMQQTPYNNGIIVQLPGVPTTGAQSVDGTMTLGITSSNVSASAAVLPLNPNTGYFTTIFSGVTYNNAFIDTGSNAYYIPSTGSSVLPICSAPYDDWYCPSTVTQLLATNKGYTGSPQVPTSFAVGNFVNLVVNGGSNRVFSDVAGISSFGFDWGLPFFLGRKVYIGYENAVAPVFGTGPLVAY